MTGLIVRGFVSIRAFDTLNVGIARIIDVWQPLLPGEFLIQPIGQSYQIDSEGDLLAHRLVAIIVHSRGSAVRASGMRCITILAS